MIPFPFELNWVPGSISKSRLSSCILKKNLRNVTVINSELQLNSGSRVEVLRLSYRKRDFKIQDGERGRGRGWPEVIFSNSACAWVIKAVCMYCVNRAWRRRAHVDSGKITFCFCICFSVYHGILVGSWTSQQKAITLSISVCCYFRSCSVTYHELCFTLVN